MFASVPSESIDALKRLVYGNTIIEGYSIHSVTLCHLKGILLQTTLIKILDQIDVRSVRGYPNPQQITYTSLNTSANRKQRTGKYSDGLNNSAHRRRAR